MSPVELIAEGRLFSANGEKQTIVGFTQNPQLRSITIEGTEKGGGTAQMDFDPLPLTVSIRVRKGQEVKLTDSVTLIGK